MPTNKDTKETVVYSKPVIEFISVSVEFCTFLEKEEEISLQEWLDNMIKMLPMLYSKAILLPKTVVIENDTVEEFVTESDYNIILSRVNKIIGENDVYLDTFKDDMKYSETPISSFISEDIADIYQDIRNFVTIYQYRMENQMYIALNKCSYNFKNYWGQKLLNMLRPIHYLFYNDNSIIDNDFTE